MPSESPTAGTARALLRELDLHHHFGFQPPSLLQLRDLNDSLERRCARAEGFGVATDVIEEAYHAIVNARNRGAGFDGLTLRELRWVPFALFYPASDISRWLANDGEIVYDYLRWISRNASTRAVSRLLRSFVVNYYPALPSFEALRVGLAGLLRELHSRRLTERKLWADEHHVLDTDGPKAFAQIWLLHPQGFTDRLNSLGRDGELSVSRFMQATEQEICEIVKKLGSRVTEQQFIGAVDALSTVADGGSVCFRNPSNGVRFTDTVLGAFASARPPEHLRTTIRQALVDRLGDPRLPSHFARWSGVSARSLQVLRRWLVDDTLRVFFDVISEALQSSPDKKAQWEARRQFWTAYLDDITDAWVGLSPAAELVTHENASFRDIPHGRMTSTNANSVLLMAIDNLLIVEFSHLGGVRYWPPSDARKLESMPPPDLFKEHYAISDFRVAAGWNVPHNEGWQARVKRIIRDETGIRGQY